MPESLREALNRTGENKSGVRLIHISGDSKWGGGGPVLLALGELGQQMGWNVDVLTTDPVGQGKVRERGLGIVDIDVIWREIRPVKDLLGLFRLYRFLRNSDYQLVHTHTSKAGFVGRIAARMAGIPVIIHTVHGFAFHERSPRLTIFVYSRLEKFAAHCCDRIVTVSNFHRDWALRLGIAGQNRLVSIPNGIDPKKLKPTRSRDSLRADWNIQAGEIVLCNAGRLAEGKGLTTLIRALPQVVADSPVPIRLVLAGEGPIRGELESLSRCLGLSGRIIFLGFRSDIGDLLHAADIVVLPSVREGLSISLLEAMSAQKPIVATTIGSNREATMAGEAAFLVGPDDHKALAEALLLAIRNPEEAAERAKKARITFESRYTVENMVNSYRLLYQSLAGKSPAEKSSGTAA